LKDNKRVDFSQDIISKTLSIKTCSRTTINVDEVSQIFDITTYFADFSRNFIGEITNMYQWILAGIGSGIGAMIVYMLLMRFFVAILVWLCILAFIIASGGGAIYLLL